MQQIKELSSLQAQREQRSSTQPKPNRGTSFRTASHSGSSTTRLLLANLGLISGRRDTEQQTSTERIHELLPSQVKPFHIPHNQSSIPCRQCSLRKIYLLLMQCPFGSLSLLESFTSILVRRALLNASNVEAAGKSSIDHNVIPESFWEFFNDLRTPSELPRANIGANELARQQLPPIVVNQMLELEFVTSDNVEDCDTVVLWGRHRRHCERYLASLENDERCSVRLRSY